MKYYFAFAALALAACGEPKKDYDAMKACAAQGHETGTKDYDQCVSDTRTERLLQQQRREFEQMKQDEQDWKLRRY